MADETALIQPVEEQTPEQLREAVESLVTKIHETHWSMGQHFVRLGNALLAIRNKQYWREYGFKNFNEYIGAVGEKIDRGRSQLYHTISVSENLLPAVGEDKLVQMGISRATELSRVAKKKNTISQALINKALEPGVKLDEVKAAAFAEIHGTPEKKGKYFDFGGAYMTGEERAEWLRAVDCARKTDPVVASNVPEWAQTKEIMQRFAREYLSTYEAAVQKGEA